MGSYPLFWMGSFASPLIPSNLNHINLPFFDSGRKGVHFAEQFEQEVRPYLLQPTKRSKAK